jgi:hypothetical protein
MNAANSAVEAEGETSVPWRASTAFTSGFCSATCAASNSFLTISGGVPCRPALICGSTRAGWRR